MLEDIFILYCGIEERFLYEKIDGRWRGKQINANKQTLVERTHMIDDKYRIDIKVTGGR